MGRGAVGNYSLVFLIWRSAAIVAPSPRKKNKKSIVGNPFLLKVEAFRRNNFGLYAKEVFFSRENMPFL